MPRMMPSSCETTGDSSTRPTTCALLHLIPDLPERDEDPLAGRAKETLLAEPISLSWYSCAGKRLTPRYHLAKGPASHGLDHGVRIPPGEEARAERNNRWGISDTRSEVTLRHDGVDQEIGV